MSTNALAALGTLESESLRILAEAPNRVGFSGTITAREPAKTVQPLIDRIHAAAIQSKVKELSVDLRSLSFVNSSAIRILINWAMTVKAEREDRRYKLQFVTSKSITWQRTSLPTLQSLAPEVVQITSL